MTQNGVSVEKDVVFGRGGDVDLLCDVYSPPAGVSKRTAIIHLHGGGFQRGSKDNGCQLAAPLAERGYVSLACDYRLAPQSKWPAPVEDVKTAIRWARANANRLGIDASKIVLAGYSAGGHLALTATGTANRPEFEGTGGSAGVGSEVAACLALYSVAELPRDADGNHPLMPAGSDDEAFRRAASINYIQPGFPPTLLFHATTDTTIPFETSMRFFEALRKANALAEMHIFEGLSHVFDRHPEFAASMAEISDLFLDRHVVDPRTYPPFGPQAIAAVTTAP